MAVSLAVKQKVCAEFPTTVIYNGVDAAPGQPARVRGGLSASPWVFSRAISSSAMWDAFRPKSAVTRDPGGRWPAAAFGEGFDAGLGAAARPELMDLANTSSPAVMLSPTPGITWAIITRPWTRLAWYRTRKDCRW